MKVDIFRIGSEYFAQAASGEMWSVSGSARDHAPNGFPLPDGNREALASADVLRDADDKFSADLNNMGDVLMDIALSVELVLVGDVMLDGRLLSAHLGSVLTIEPYVYKLNGDDLMVAVAGSEWEAALMHARRNLVAAAVLRADRFSRQAAKVAFHRPTGAYF